MRITVTCKDCEIFANRIHTVVSGGHAYTEIRDDYNRRLYERMCGHAYRTAFGGEIPLESRIGEVDITDSHITLTLYYKGRRVRQETYTADANAPTFKQALNILEQWERDHIARRRRRARRTRV